MTPIRETISLCPVCLRQLPARHVQDGNDIFLQKTCPEHGDFSAVIWRHNDKLPMADWLGGAKPMAPGTELPCPDGCGLCDAHTQSTCCVLLEVTNRCNLSCPNCLAGGLAGEDPTLDEIQQRIDRLLAEGCSFLQISGGEPTLRDDLPEIIAYAKDSGFGFVQLNTNGLRLAEDDAYVQALAKAGLSFVFMQFDGTCDAIYEKLRGKPLLRQKQLAIHHCNRHRLGVTLVPMIAPGVNAGDIGAILRFAVATSPAVRGVHFQPISYLGAHTAPVPDADRFTLPELLLAIEAQTDGMVEADTLVPSQCDHAACGFHGDFVVVNGALQSLGAPRQASCCGPSAAQQGAPADCCASPALPDDSASYSSPLSAAEKSRRFVGRRWERATASVDFDALETPGLEVDFGSFDGFLKQVRSHGFTITSMGFQDRGNIDLERLRQCSLHVYDGENFHPLCARYLGDAIG
ncbi:MAG: radical SAM protein [Ruminococcaceae bacterium]|nr:radical SAM protein [Oscillospiraceae bacterium]